MLEASFAEGVRFCPHCRAAYRSDFRRCPLDGGLLETVDRDPLLGATISEHYTIEACIAYGATSRVYRAHHSRLTRRSFAIKVLLGDLTASAATRIRFAQEAEMLSTLNHPNVVSVVDFARTPEGLLYLVMDLASGPSLAEIIRLSGPLAWRRAVNLAQQLLLGLGHAHEHGIVHRDFKPDNVIVEYAAEIETPRIVDFGIALTTRDQDASPRITGIGLSMGTPAYAAPEQTRNLNIDHRADLFALGVTMYEMLTGKLPFDGNATELVYANALQDPPAFAVRAPEIEAPEELERVVLRLMSRDPRHRPASAQEALHALDQLAGAVPLKRRSTATIPPYVASANTTPASLVEPARPIESTRVGGGRSEDTMVIRNRERAGGITRAPARPRKARWPYYVIAASLLVVAAVVVVGVKSPGTQRALQVSLGLTDPEAAVEVRAPAATTDQPATTAPAADGATPSEPVAATTELLDPAAEPAVAAEPGDLIEPAVAAEPAVATEPTSEDAKASGRRAYRAAPRSPEDGDRAAASRVGPMTRWTPAVATAASAEPGPAEPATPTPAFVTNAPAAPEIAAADAIAGTTPPVPLPTPPPAPTPVAGQLPPPVPLPAIPPPKPKPPVPTERVLAEHALQVTGSLSRSVVERALGRVRPSVAQCAKLATSDSAIVRFIVDERGRAASIRVAGTGAGLAECLRKALSDLRTESPPDVGTVDSVLKLGFRLQAKP